jgi:hypothetical protein
MRFSFVLDMLSEPNRSHWWRPRLALIGFALAATIWGLLDVRRREYQWEHRTDLTVFTEAGAAFFDGRPPYEVANVRGWTYLYPPMFALLLAPLHVLGGQNQVTVWFFFNLLLCWGCCREFRRLLGIVCADPATTVINCVRWVPWLVVLAFLAALLPTLNCLQRGQVGVVKFYLLLLGFRLVLSGRGHRSWIAGGIVLSFPIVLKIIPLLPVGFVLFVQFVAWMHGRATRSSAAAAMGKRLAASTIGVAIGLLLFFLVIPAILVGWNANLRHLDTWAHFMLTKADDGGMDPRSGNSHSGRNESLQNATYRFGNFTSHVLGGACDDRLVERFDAPTMAMDAPWVGHVLWAARFALLLALLVTGIHLGCGAGGRLDHAVGFALGCATMLVVSPVARGHYFMLLSPGVLFLPLWLERRHMRQMAVAMAVFPPLLVVMHYAALSQSGRLGLLGLGTTAWLMAAMVLVSQTEKSQSPASTIAAKNNGHGSSAMTRAA